MDRRTLLTAGVTGAMAAASLPLAASVAEAGTTTTWCQRKRHIAVLGASTEAGKGLSDYVDPGDGGYAPTRYGWVSQVSRMSKAAWGTQVHNYSHSGASVRDYQPGGRWDDSVGAVDDMHTYGPDVIIIDLGANEFMNGIGVDEFETGLADLITRARNGNHVDVLILGHWRIAMQKPTPWSAYIGAMYRTARDLDCSMIDFTQFIDASDNDGANLWIDGDHHLNEAGQTVVTGAVWSWLLFACDDEGGE